MRYRVDVNRSQFDARPVVVLPFTGEPLEGDFDPIDTEVHVFTDAELRARDERIIRATHRRWFHDGPMSSDYFDAIIATAEAGE